MRRGEISIILLHDMFSEIDELYSSKSERLKNYNLVIKKYRQEERQVLIDDLMKHRALLRELKASLIGII
jgi:hypothetical protein